MHMAGDANASGGNTDTGQKGGKDGEQKKGQQAPAAAQQEGDAEYRERLLRLAAEFDNYKKRVKNDVENAKTAGKAELVRGLLPALDEFDLAVAMANGSADKTLGKGIEMVYSNIMGELRKSGLSEIPASGMYDPYKHEIILAREERKKPGTILEVVKKGYMFGGMMIRPASVIIAREVGAGEAKPEGKEAK